MPRTQIEVREQIEVHAPPEEVFALLVDRERRFQLAPDWGDYQILDFSPEYPRSGSSYQLQKMDEEAAPFTVWVTGYEPERHFSYQVQDESELRADWILEPNPQGTLLTYYARFLASSEIQRDPDIEDLQAERKIEEAEKDLGVRLRLTAEETAARDARNWLGSIKRYAELREGRLQLGMRWLFDRYILRLRAEQRRIILAVVGLQIVMLLTFIAAAVGLGLASLIF